MRRRTAFNPEGSFIGRLHGEKISLSGDERSNAIETMKQCLILRRSVGRQASCLWLFNTYLVRFYPSKVIRKRWDMTQFILFQGSVWASLPYRDCVFGYCSGLVPQRFFCAIELIDYNIIIWWMVRQIYGEMDNDSDLFSWCCATDLWFVVSGCVCLWLM